MAQYSGGSMSDDAPGCLAAMAVLGTVIACVSLAAVIGFGLWLFRQAPEVLGLLACAAAVIVAVAWMKRKRRG